MQRIATSSLVLYQSIRSHRPAYQSIDRIARRRRIVASHVRNKVVETHPHRTAFPLDSSHQVHHPHHEWIPYPLPHISISNPAYRHPLPSSFPYISVNILTAALPPHLHFRLLPARVSPSAKSASLFAARVFRNFFRPRPTPLTSEPYNTATTSQP